MGRLRRRGWWLLGDRSRGRRCFFLDGRLETRPVRLAVDHQIERVVLEAVDGRLSEQRVAEDREPIGCVAIAGDDPRSAGVSLDEELVDVAALFSGHRLEREVIDDQETVGVATSGARGAEMAGSARPTVAEGAASAVGSALGELGATAVSEVGVCSLGFVQAARDRRSRRTVERQRRFIGFTKVRVAARATPVTDHVRAAPNVGRAGLTAPPRANPRSPPAPS